MPNNGTNTPNAHREQDENRRPRNVRAELRVNHVRLRESISYNHQTGALTWLQRPALHFRSERDCNAWNSSFAGKPAFNCLNGGGYLVGGFSSILILAHRVAWLCHYGDWPLQYIDHINGDKTDNRISNLRVASSVENQRNRRRKSGRDLPMGVQPHGKKWVARIADGQGGNSHIGLFKTIDEAAQAWRTEARARGFHENHGREEDGWVPIGDLARRLVEKAAPPPKEAAE